MKTGSSPGFYPWTSNPYRGTAARRGGRGPGRTCWSGWSRWATSAGPRAPRLQPPPLGAKTATAYNAEYTTVTDPAGKTRRSRLDGLDRLVRVG